MNEVDKKTLWHLIWLAIGAVIFFCWMNNRPQPAPQETTFHGEFHGRFVIYPVSGQP